MSSGYTYLALGLGSFSLLGIFAKIADLKRCRPTALYVTVCFAAALLSAAAALAFGQNFSRTPRIVVGIAIPFGALAALAGIAFQAGIRYGKLATSWLIINLSAAVPTIGSVLFFHEEMSVRHAAALCLMALSVVLLWKDKQADERKARLAAQPAKEKVCG
jgi:drug/metabolite transporter (DMT)-like permease